MAVSPEDARKELARRELERRRTQIVPPVVEAQPSSRMIGARRSDGPIKFGGLDFLKTIGGLGESALQIGSGALATPIAGLAGIGAMLPGGRSPAEAVEGVSSFLTYQPRTDQGQAISTAIAEPAMAADAAATDLLDTGNPEASTALKTLLFGGPSALLLKNPGTSALARQTAPKPVAPVPSTTDLFKAGSQAFDKARTLGGGVRPESLDRLANSIVTIKKENGLSVRINESLHPKAHATQSEIMKTISKGEVTFDDLIELRELAQEAAGALDKKDAFRGQLLKNKIDEYVDSLGVDDVAGGNPEAAAASLKEARAAWHKASKASTLEQAIDLAGANAGAFHGAGFENAVRTQFRALHRRIIKGQEKGFTPDEIALIKRTANGASLDNIYRWLGKMAPTGIVSGGLGSGLGFAFGGPLGAALVPAVGLLGRHLATKATAKNASDAVRLTQSGGLIDP